MKENSIPCPWLPNYIRTSSILLAVFYLVGLVGHGSPALLPYMLLLTPYTILGTIILVILPYILLNRTRLLAWAAITAIVTLILEIVGVKTGLIFGSYIYGETLGLKFLEVPLIIGLNWVMVVLAAITLMERFTTNFWYKIAGTAIITTIFDIMMEPVAMRLDYWIWDGGTIPLQNYIAWATISAAGAILYEKMKLENRDHYQVWAVMTIQFLFFVGLRIIFRV